jgi:hypothetical protein
MLLKNMYTIIYHKNCTLVHWTIRHFVSGHTFHCGKVMSLHAFAFFLYQDMTAICLCIVTPQRNIT